MCFKKENIEVENGFCIFKIMNEYVFKCFVFF